MDVLVNDLIAILDNVNGSIIYPELLAAWPPEKRGLLPKVITLARSQNLIERQIALVEGVVTHTLTKVVTP